MSNPKLELLLHPPRLLLSWHQPRLLLPWRPKILQLSWQSRLLICGRPLDTRTVPDDLWKYLTTLLSDAQSNVLRRVNRHFRSIIKYKTGFKDVPKVLVAYLGEFLDAHSCSRLRRVCKRFRQCVRLPKMHFWNGIIYSSLFMDRGFGGRVYST